MTERPPVARAAIPNTVTALGVFLGYLSILFTLEANYLLAAWLIVIAGVIDMMDGRLARLVKGSSKFGGYFDSLADAINYGVAPSLLFYHLYMADWSLFGAAVSFLPTLCGAIRLARFTVLTDDSGKSDFFVGLPTTVAAGFLASYVIFAYDVFGNPGLPLTALGLLITASLLMVSAVPYEHNGTLARRSLNWKVLLTLAALVTLALFPARALFIWTTVYISLGLLRGLLTEIRQRITA